MNRKKSRTTLRTPNSKTRCNFQFADGRRCRMLRHQTSGELCLFHNRELLQLQSAAEIGAELLDLGGNFQNPIAINFVLGKLFAHVATGRMHRRNASTLAYIAQLLLQTLDQKRYDLARDQYDYRGFTRAIAAKYRRRKRRPLGGAYSSVTHSQPPATQTPAAAGAAPNSEADPLPSFTPPRPANPEYPESLPDTPWLRELAQAKKAHANQPSQPPPRL
jgi:hypothetical protein